MDLLLRNTLLLLVVNLILKHSAGQDWSKIDPTLQSSLASKPLVNVFVTLKNGDTAPVLTELESSFRFQSSQTHGERTTIVANALKSHAKFSQKEVLKFISQKFPEAHVRSFWITNQIYLNGVDRNIVETLSKLYRVVRIYEEEESHIRHFYYESSHLNQDVEARNVQEPEWGLKQMRVPEVWRMDGGNMGEGLIIGNIDTGVRGSHELLSSKWVGLENNGWYDPEGKTAVPHDVYNHGTHTMGMLVGGKGIGIVPGGKWLACKGYRDNGSASASTFIACCEYMLCPTDFEGNNPDCSKAPHVVSNSWGWNGGTAWFNPAIHAWNTAGLLSSFSAGNTGGQGCGSIYSPADQPDILAVGATDSLDALAGFSSLGPSPYGQMKPEISAPGVQILSASAESDKAMMTVSGTSMSCPSASGVLALLKNHDQNLFQARALQILEKTTNRTLSTGESCDEISDDVYPNNHAGYGRIDAYSAMVELMKSTS